MATLKDVAAKVGVSITTVSRVLNNRGSISQETKDKVFKVMKEMNYFPNEMARSLSNKNSHLIGLIVPYIDHTFFGVLTAAIEEACYKLGYKLFLCTSGGHSDREKELFSMLQANNVAGVLVCSRVVESSAYKESAIPLVSIERTIDDIPSISCDNYKGGVLAAQELIASGCEHLLLIGNRIVSEHLPAYLRYKGFRDECQRTGKAYSEHYIDSEDIFGKNLDKNVKDIIKRYPLTDGIFATSDVLAAHLFNSLGNSQEFPKRYKLVGFDGLDISEYCGISTIAQPIRQMGELAVDVLIKRINESLVAERYILPVSLIRRKTSCPQTSNKIK
ncbi:LacI family DNA-binding transcriptional regulator [Scatolibacter rhodanostii]|uniref:LacI family DNA-binding transcriptional regulator n=1 Tax=Scatolibacter rhodanostii TaxID=2014781 RepID=UPI000C069551|nr:LacI family DNA-binding transcriptional regulator [Scatolibacter rhodanostii]